MKVPEKYYCDICGKEIRIVGEISKKTFINCGVWVHDMATDRIGHDNIDICPSCRKKTVVITKRKVTNEDGEIAYRYDIIASEPAKEAYTEVVMKKGGRH